jgi:N-acetylmuramoyl-L-alanine amidase
MTKIILCLVSCLLLLTACASAKNVVPQGAAAKTGVSAPTAAVPAAAKDKEAAVAAAKVIAPAMVDKFLPWTAEREKLTRAYAEKHYSKSITTIEPQAVVVHWTAGPTWQSAWQWFANAGRGDGTVNVSSQFIVDRDGTIYRLMPETKLARHIIGYNWCAIGIENVGGVNDKEDLTPAQLAADTKLIGYLAKVYPGIKYVWGHYQQDTARASGLYIENVAGYRSYKTDPGPKFMRGLQANLAGTGLTFYPE